MNDLSEKNHKAFLCSWRGSWVIGLLGFGVFLRMRRFWYTATDIKIIHLNRSAVTEEYEGKNILVSLCNVLALSNCAQVIILHCNLKSQWKAALLYIFVSACVLGKSRNFSACGLWKWRECEGVWGCFGGPVGWTAPLSLWDACEKLDLTKIAMDPQVTHRKGTFVRFFSLIWGLIFLYFSRV